MLGDDFVTFGFKVVNHEGVFFIIYVTNNTMHIRFVRKREFITLATTQGRNLVVHTFIISYMID